MLTSQNDKQTWPTELMSLRMRRAPTAKSYQLQQNILGKHAKNQQK